MLLEALEAFPKLPRPDMMLEFRIVVLLPGQLPEDTCTSDVRAAFGSSCRAARAAVTAAHAWRFGFWLGLGGSDSVAQCILSRAFKNFAFKA